MSARRWPSPPWPRDTKCRCSTPTRSPTSAWTRVRGKTWEEAEGKFTVGTALETDALIEAGIERADVFIASTAGDNTNLVISQIAQRRFGVEKVLVRVMDPARAEWYGGQGLSTISPTKHAIEEFELALTPEAA